VFIGVVRIDNMHMPTITRGRAVAYLVAILAALVLGGRFLLASDSAGSTSGRTQTLESIQIDRSETGEASPEDLVVVHVAGAVRRPGLYRLPVGSRIDDAIRAAGGAKPRAALALVNLAAPVADGQQVLVPGQERPGSPSAQASAGGATSPPAQVRLNTATLEDLDGLPGVGPVTAQRILDYRGQHGAFASIDELDAVPGIGPTRLEQLRELLTL
jgi:competence protein ComEA